MMQATTQTTNAKQEIIKHAGTWIRAFQYSFLGKRRCRCACTECKSRESKHAHADHCSALRFCFDITPATAHSTLQRGNRQTHSQQSHQQCERERKTDSRRELNRKNKNNTRPRSKCYESLISS